MKQKYINLPWTFSSTLIRMFITFVINYNFLSANAQELNTYLNAISKLPVKEYHTSLNVNCKKRFWRATSEWSITQVLPWASNRYIRKAAFAKISIKSLTANLKPANWEWDDNKFFNNQISHPFHGALYFNSFRNNGYSFWQSVSAVLAGTYAWETIFETHVPAPNDLINTALGGIALGEMIHRLSSVILRKKTGKINASFRETTAFLVNPVQGLNRVLYHDMGNKNGPKSRDFISVNMVADAGIRFIENKQSKNLSKIKREIFGRIQLEYGDPYSQFKEPFSNFSMAVEAGSSDSSNAIAVQIEGRIFGKKINASNKVEKGFSISINYEFFNNSRFSFSAQSFKANVLSSISLYKKIELQLKTGVGLTPLAAMPNAHMYYGEGRNYDYCTGINLQVGIGINIANKIFYSFNCNGLGAVTVNGYKSFHSFYNYSSILRMKLHKKITLIMNSGNYFFNGNYTNFKNVHDKVRFDYIGIGYKIAL